MIHIYPQAHEHDEAMIVGDKGSLRKLRDALNMAMANDSASCGLMTADGEGYAAIVVCVPDPVIETLVVPYAEPLSVSQHTGAAPHTLLPEGRYKELVERTYEEEG